MANMDLVEILKREDRAQRILGLHCWKSEHGERNLNLTCADLRNVDLSGLILIGANFTGADLRGANLSNAILTSANFAGADLRGCNIKRTVLRYAKFRKTHLQDLDFSIAILSKCVLRALNM